MPSRQRSDFPHSSEKNIARSFEGDIDRAANGRSGSSISHMMQDLYNQYGHTGDVGGSGTMYALHSPHTPDAVEQALLESSHQMLASLHYDKFFDDSALPAAFSETADENRVPVAEGGNGIPSTKVEDETFPLFPQVLASPSASEGCAYGMRNVDMAPNFFEGIAAPSTLEGFYGRYAPSSVTAQLFGNLHTPYMGLPSPSSHLLPGHMLASTSINTQPVRHNTEYEYALEQPLGSHDEPVAPPMAPEIPRGVLASHEAHASEAFALQDTMKENHPQGSPSTALPAQDDTPSKHISTCKRKRVDRENVPGIIAPTGERDHRRSGLKKSRTEFSASTSAGPSPLRPADAPRPRRTNDKLEPIEMRPKTRCGLGGCSESLKAPDLAAARAHMKSHLPKFTESQAKAKGKKTTRTGNEKATNSYSSNVAGPSNAQANPPAITRTLIDCPYISPGGEACEHKPFVNLQSLQRHIEGDHYDWGFQCPHCGRWFKRRDALTRHQASEHPHPKPQ
ncbi:hypothetical protein C8Q77DRAFT_1156301 [Trametes polyzona]|nr:hypothetical protein C8Q77DRAFT_1156301 [Trametes polyzona]